MEYRLRAVEYKDEGHTFKELSEAFKISSTTYYEWKNKIENAYYEQEHHFQRKRKIDKQKLAMAVSPTPDAYLRELAEPFTCTEQAVFYALKKLGIPYKKTVTYSEKSPQKRQQYLKELEKIPLEERNYVDECGINGHEQRKMARALPGKIVEGITNGTRSRRLNVGGALCNGTHVAVHTYTHSMKGDYFEAWFFEHLLEAVSEGHTIIMDNASFHRKGLLEILAKQAGVKRLFLPPYSPDLNPIEHSGANLKRWLTDNELRFPSLHSAVFHFFALKHS